MSILCDWHQNTLRQGGCFKNRECLPSIYVWRFIQAQITLICFIIQV